MKKWCVLNLGDAMLVLDELERIKALLFTVYELAGKPNDMAAFIRHESEGRLHCEVKIYLSPALAAQARVVDAEPCVKPEIHDLGLLVGASDSWLNCS